MTIDDFSKLLLILVISFGVGGISFQLMRLIGGFADTIQDFRLTVKNLGDFTTKLNRDYDDVIKQVKGFANSIGNIGRNVIDPITNMLGFLKRFKIVFI